MNARNGRGRLPGARGSQGKQTWLERLSAWMRRRGWR